MLRALPAQPHASYDSESGDPVDPAAPVKPMLGVFVTVQVVYLLGLAALASVSYRKTGTLAEFLVMGRSAGAFLTGTAYFATQFSMSSLVGVPGEIYSIGFAGLGIILSIAMFSMAFGVLVAGRKLRRLSVKLDLLTLPDYVASRYASNAARMLCALVIILFLIPYLAAQIVGAGVIFNVFTGSPYSFGAVLMGVVVIGYCLAGGMRATVLTDALQGVLMVLAAIATFVAVAARGGGLQNVMERLAAVNPGAMSFPGHPVAYFTWKTYVSQILMWTLFSIGQPQLINKYLVAKDYGSLLKASILSGAGMTITCFTVWTAGVMGMIVTPGIKNPDWVMPTMLAVSVGPFFASLIQAGIISAGMSTISSLLVVVAGAVSRDIYQKMINPGAGDRIMVRISRGMTVVVGAVVLGIALVRPATIFRLVLFAWSGAGIMAVPILGGLYWKRATGAGAAASVAVGITAILVLTFKLPWLALGFHPIIVSAALAAAALIAVSLLTSPSPLAALHDHFPARAPRRPLQLGYGLILAALFFLVWMPVSFIFPWKQYLPGWFGVPVFIWVWVGIQAATGMVLHFYRQRVCAPSGEECAGGD